MKPNAVPDVDRAAEHPQVGSSSYGVMLALRGGGLWKASHDPVVQELVLLSMAAGSIRWPNNNMAVDDDLAGEKLFRRQIGLSAVGKPIPIVVSDLGPLDVYLSQDQFTTKEILHN